MTHPNPGPPQHPHQPYPAQPYPNQPYAGQPYPGQPYADQPHPGRPYAGPPYPAYPQPPLPPRAPSKAMPVVAGLLYLPGVLLALVGAIGLASRSGFAFELWGAILVPPLIPDPGSFAVLFVLPVLALVLAVLLMARVPGVRWGLVAISLIAVVHFALVVANVSSVFPLTYGIVPVIALVLWLVAGVVAALPPVGRATRGATPKAPPHHPPGAHLPPGPPPLTGPPPPTPGQWG
ncbi:MAG: hypothetical protein HOQ46_23805 [Saccharothrix sp.]|nr:hypothetical protein [Saccharothrix sp.]